MKLTNLLSLLPFNGSPKTATPEPNYWQLWKILIKNVFVRDAGFFVAPIYHNSIVQPKLYFFVALGIAFVTSWFFYQTSKHLFLIKKVV